MDIPFFEVNILGKYVSRKYLEPKTKAIVSPIYGIKLRWSLSTSAKGSTEEEGSREIKNQSRPKENNLVSLFFDVFNAKKINTPIPTMPKMAL